MARANHRPSFAAAPLFDRRFEPVIAEGEAQADAPSSLAKR